MMAFGKLFVVAVVAAVLPLVAMSQEFTCTDPLDVKSESLPFTEQIDTTELSSYLLKFNNGEQLEVKGKWYHMVGNDEVIGFDTCSENTDFDTFIAGFLSCNQSSDRYYYHSFVHTNTCNLAFHGDVDTEYFVIVGGLKRPDKTFNQGRATVSISYIQPPVEHVCEHAVEVTELPYSVKANSVASEGVIDGCRYNASNPTYYSGMWYHFKGTGKFVTVRTCDSETDYDSHLSIFTDCEGTCVVQDDDGCGLRSVVTFNAIDGQDYYVFVTGRDNERGTFILTIEEVGYQDHGYCTDAIEIDTLPFSYHGNTKLLPLVDNACHEGNPRRGMWFHIASVESELIALTCDDNIYDSDTVIDVFLDCDSATNSSKDCFDTDDDFCGLDAAVVLPARENGYYIYVSALTSRFEGMNFTLTVRNNKNQTNDRCWRATKVSTLPMDFEGNTRDMTTASQLSCNSKSGNRTGAWFYYINKDDEPRHVGVTTCNAENIMKADLEVYSNCDECVSYTPYIPSTNCTTVVFFAKKGETFSIFVTNATGEEAGFFHVDFYEDSPRENQHCDKATSVESLPYYDAGFTGVSEASFSGCDGGSYQGSWYHIRGTGQHMMAVTTPSATFFDTVLELYSGCPTNDASTCIVWNDDVSHQSFSSTLEWDSEANKDYWLFVRGYGGAYGFYTLHVFETSAPVNSKCTDAIPIVPNQLIVGYTAYASNNNASCVETLRKGIWYKMHTNSSGTITLTTCDVATAFETDIEVYEECTQSGATGCVPHTHDLKCPPGQSLKFTVDEGDKDYYIFVTGVRTDIEVSGLFRMQSVFRAAERNSTSSSSGVNNNSSSNSNSPVSDESSSSSSDPYIDHALEIVEVFLVVFGFAWLCTIVFTIYCCYYKSHNTQMESATVVDKEEQSSGYVPPAVTVTSYADEESQVSMHEI